MRLFVNGLLEQTRRHQMQAELIMVEWNPPADRPLLKEILPAPGPEDLLTIRYIIVPKAIHDRYQRGDVIPLFQMIGKNVGIRRARGEWVLCTNIDLIFTNQIFERIKSGTLDGKKFYRANRVDVPDQISEDWPLDQQLDFAQNHVIRRLGFDPDFRYLRAVPNWIYRHRWLAKLLNGVFKWLIPRLEKPYAKYRFNLLDKNACGDFTLMTKAAWIDIQGYLELDLYSIHIDTLALVAAASLGYEQEIFPVNAFAYHIDHPVGWEAMTPLEKIKFVQERPGIGFDLVWETAMEALAKPMHFNANPPDWGFEGIEFEEITLKGGKSL
ncbi:MAG: hypothetical protein H6581_22265 [Bacteroidia bacterium]|nr:hypothetical protein [Bacteroidia bacterium]